MEMALVEQKKQITGVGKPGNQLTNAKVYQKVSGFEITRYQDDNVDGVENQTRYKAVQEANSQSLCPLERLNKRDFNIPGTDKKRGTMLKVRRFGKS